MIVYITRRVDNTTKKAAYADDLTAAEKIIQLKHWWETLFKIGPKFGYHLQKQPPEVFCKKDVLRNFAKFNGKHLCQRPAILLKERRWHRCFHVNFSKFLRTPFLQNTSGRLEGSESWLIVKKHS